MPHEESVDAVVEVLSAEVPKMQAGHLNSRSRDWQQDGLHGDTVCAVSIRLEVFAAESSADLRLAGPPIPEDQYLDVR